MSCPQRNGSARGRKRRYVADESECDDEPISGDLGVQALGQHIYFYADVTSESVLELSKLLRAAGEATRKRSCDLEGFEPRLFLHINSTGGDVFASLAAVDTIRASKVPVVTIVEGIAASAATMISIAGQERWITKHASMLVHQLSSGFWGKLNEIQDECINLKYLEEKTKKMYLEFCKGKMKPKRLEKWLKRDIYMDAEACCACGLCDRIVSASL